MQEDQPRPPVWHGTHQEAADLLTAALHHCTCVVDDNAARVVTCPPHLMVFTDQRAINGLLFGRRMYQRWRDEEFAPTTAAPTA
jgi:hypothetical protein